MMEGQYRLKDSLGNLEVLPSIYSFPWRQISLQFKPSCIPTGNLCSTVSFQMAEGREWEVRIEMEPSFTITLHGPHISPCSIISYRRPIGLTIRKHLYLHIGGLYCTLQAMVINSTPGAFAQHHLRTILVLVFMWAKQSEQQPHSCEYIFFTFKRPT